MQGGACRALCALSMGLSLQAPLQSGASRQRSALHLRADNRDASSGDFPSIPHPPPCPSLPSCARSLRWVLFPSTELLFGHTVRLGAGLKAARGKRSLGTVPLLSCPVFWEGRDAAPAAAGWVQQEVEPAELGV